MKAFLTKYSGLTHTIATGWLFLVGAYTANVGGFRDIVNGDVVDVYHSLPANMAKIASGLFALAVPLWAFYRNGQKGSSATVEVLPGESGEASAKVSAKLVPTAAFALLSLGAFALTGCPGQSIAAGLIDVAGTAVAGLETYDGNAALATKAQTDFSALAKAVADFKAGTATQDIKQLGDDVLDDLNLFPVSNGDMALITLAIGTVDEVLALFPSTPAATGNVIVAQRLHVPHRSVGLTSPPRKRAEFVSEWNTYRRAFKPDLPELK